MLSLVSTEQSSENTAACQKTNRPEMDLPKPNTTAPDGSPIKLYRLLKPAGEPEIVQSVLRPGSSILELGCGVGRITHPLLAAGFDVVPVDNSPEMLKSVECEKKLQADIETLNLHRKFDAVLLMSHFINVPDDALRAALLMTCHRHLAPEGSRYRPAARSQLAGKCKHWIPGRSCRRAHLS